MNLIVPRATRPPARRAILLPALHVPNRRGPLRASTTRHGPLPRFRPPRDKLCLFSIFACPTSPPTFPRTSSDHRRPFFNGLNALHRGYAPTPVEHPRRRVSSTGGPPPTSSSCPGHHGALCPDLEHRLAAYRPGSTSPQPPLFSYSRYPSFHGGADPGAPPPWLVTWDPRDVSGNHPVRLPPETTSATSCCGRRMRRRRGRPSRPMAGGYRLLPASHVTEPCGRKARLCSTPGHLHRAPALGVPVPSRRVSQPDFREGMARRAESWATSARAPGPLDRRARAPTVCTRVTIPLEGAKARIGSAGQLRIDGPSNIVPP